MSGARTSLNHFTEKHPEVSETTAPEPAPGNLQRRKTVTFSDEEPQKHVIAVEEEEEVGEEEENHSTTMPPLSTGESFLMYLLSKRVLPNTNLPPLSKGSLFNLLLRSLMMSQKELSHLMNQLSFLLDECVSKMDSESDEVAAFYNDVKEQLSLANQAAKEATKEHRVLEYHGVAPMSTRSLRALRQAAEKDKKRFISRFRRKSWVAQLRKENGMDN